jgi:tetratricopeptide (TPR) repeat protein
MRRSSFLSQEAFLHKIAPQEVASAHRLCQLLDGLPLALDQAGAYIEKTGCGVAEYEQRYHSQQLALLQQRGEVTMDHPASVVTTWSLTFKHLERYDPCAADLLRACAFLAPEAIPQAIFQKGASQLGSPLAEICIDALRFDAVISTLRQFSLVRRDPQTRTISVHRLVQAVLRALMPADQQALWAERVIRALCAAFPHRQGPEWQFCAFYLAHVAVCEELLAHYHLSLPAMGGVVYQVGRFFHEHGQYHEAGAWYYRARELCQTAPMGESADGLPHILESLGWRALGQRRLVDAYTLLQQALVLKQQIYGDCHAQTAITLHALGRVVHAQQHFEEAEQFYRQALSIKEQVLGKEHAETAKTVLALGWLMSDQQRYTQAYDFYQQAFHIRLKVLGTEHVGTAVVLHLLARLAQHQQQDHEAEALFLQALAIKERVLSTDHPSIAITLQALARFYHEQQRLHEAEIKYKEALRIREGMLEPEHLLTAETLYHYAHLCSSQQRWQEAEAMYRRALASQERAFGWNHPTVQTMVQGYAQLLRSIHRDKEAQALEQRGTTLSRTPYHTP